MTVAFSIDPKNPEPNEVAGAIVGDLSDGVEAVFSLDSTDAIMVWQGVRIPISYKYDISVMMEDIVEMLEGCLREGGAAFHISFASNTFNSNWSVRVTGDAVGVTAQWRSVTGRLEDQLNATGPILVARLEFVRHWLSVLCVALDAVERVDVRMRDVRLLTRARALCSSSNLARRP